MAETGKNRNEDINSKIADFMADIDEIVLGKKSNSDSEQSQWQQCFDESTQAVYYWNSKTNECSWEPPSITNRSSSFSPPNNDEKNRKKRQQTTTNKKPAKKMKKPSLIAAYTSSDSGSSEEEEEENVDDIDELLNEVLDKKEKTVSIDRYPSFEADCRAAITRLTDLRDKTPDIFTLRIQLETRLEDCLAGHLSKSYAVSKLEQALLQIDELEKSHLSPAPSLYVPEPLKPTLTTSEMALLLSLPPPPPPSSPPPPTNTDDEALQLFYAQLNCDQPDSMPIPSDTGKVAIVTKSESHHHHHHHHKDKKSKPSKTLPTDLIQKWTHARQELRGGIVDIDDS